ncbi:MAG: transferrin receptor-like dimerization domain-containing protein, partial [Gemmatimonadota bacterium]
DTAGDTGAAAGVEAVFAFASEGAASAADRANAHLMRVERALTREAGLPGRPWYRYLIFAADRRNGYATLALPGIAEAIRAADASRVRAEAADLAERVGRATEALRRAADALTAPVDADESAGG